MVDYEKRSTVTLAELMPAWWGTEHYEKSAEKSDSRLSAKYIFIQPPLYAISNSFPRGIYLTFGRKCDILYSGFG